MDYVEIFWIQHRIEYGDSADNRISFKTSLHGRINFESLIVGSCLFATAVFIIGAVSKRASKNCCTIRMLFC